MPFLHDLKSLQDFGKSCGWAAEQVIWLNLFLRRHLVRLIYQKSPKKQGVSLIWSKRINGDKKWS